MGDNSFQSNLIASVIGCLFYFATLTEIPILEALMKNGMASGPALALLLAGPALSIPSILVIRSILGNVKTVAFCLLVIVMATVAGMGYGALFPGHPRPSYASRMVTWPRTPDNSRCHGMNWLVPPYFHLLRNDRMKLVQVLGPGCGKCAKLKENAESAVRELGLEASVEKIDDINVITGFGVMMTPALVIDGEVKAVGKVCTTDEIKQLLQS